MRRRRTRTSRPRLRTVIVGGLIATGFLLSAAVLAVEFETGLGVQVTLLAALFAALPLLVVVPTFLWLDRYEAEPTRMLILAFAWGAVCAPAGALFLNTGIAIAMRLAGAEDPDLETAVFGAPFVEEGLKGFGVLLIVLLRRREFDGVVDGIVYAGLVGAGFAFSENILYLGREFVEYGQQGLTELFILRCIMGPFAHPLFTAFTGIGLGLAVAVMRSAWSRVLVALGGFLLAALLHGIWNLSAADRTPDRGLRPVPGSAVPLLPRSRRRAAVPRGAADPDLPQPVRRRRMAQPPGGRDALVGAGPAPGPDLGQPAGRQGRGRVDASVPGRGQ